MAEFVTLSVKDAHRLEGHILVVSVPLDGEPKDLLNDSVRRLTEAQYHRQLDEMRPLHSGDLIFAKKEQPHGLGFEDILFVIDDQRTPLRDLITSALIFADDELEASKVILPLFWTVGDMARRGLESDPEELIHDAIRGLTTFGTQCTPDFEVIFPVADLTLARKLRERVENMNKGITALWAAR